MVRSVRMAAVVLGVVWTGLAGAQSPSPLEKARYIHVTEEGKPPQRCKLLKTWREADGSPAFQVQAVDTGELITIVGSSQQGSGGDPRAMSTRIFRWGHDNKSPAGAPVSPPSATVLTAPPSPAAAPVPAPTMARNEFAPVVKPLPTAPALSTASSRSAPFLPTMQKPDVAPAPAPVQSANKPYFLTSNKPTLTPMGTQVVQHPATQTQAELPPASTTTTGPQSRLVPLAAGSNAGTNSGNSACSPCGSCCQPCNPCNQSSCVNCTPSPMRQPFISRLFKSNNNSTSTAAASKPVTPTLVKPVSTMPPPALAKAATEPAKPGDWRESWGKVEPWKAPLQASSNKPKIELTKRVNPAPVPMEPARQPDPLKAPDHYRDLVMNAKLTNSKIPQQESQPSAGSKLSALRHPLSAFRRTDKADNGQRIVVSGSPTVHPVEETVVVNAPQQMPHGPMTANMPPQQGIPAPNMAMGAPALIPPAPPPTRVVQIAANEANAFWSPTPPPGIEKDKSKNPGAENEAESSQGIQPVVIRRGPVPVPPRGPMLVNAPRPPMAPYTTPGVPRPMSPDTGVPGSMGNAFTLTATSRPIPADFGGTPQEPNGFDLPMQMGQGSPPIGYGMANPGMARPAMPNMMAMAPQIQMPVNPLMSVPPALPTVVGAVPAGMSGHPASVPQSLVTLKNSLYPSERESAAEQLSELNWRSQPQVVECLMKAAREDPAATVRAACIHALAQMKVNTPGAVALVRDLKSDRDPRVRQEAEEALHTLSDTGIQQASHK